MTSGVLKTTFSESFGKIEEYKHFRRFYYCRLEKVNTVWAIVCIAHNFRKLARLEYGF